MKLKTIAFLSAMFMPAVAFSANEGVPSYYQTNKAPNGNQASYGKYASKGYTKYKGDSAQGQVVGTRNYSYQTPRQTTTILDGTMTVNGIATPVESEHRTTVYAGYSRRFADFQFETGVNSVLEWDDMIFNEINVGAQHNFSVRNFDMFVYGQYAYGSLASGGLSMDYDLKPYDTKLPEYGVFTVSVGDQSGHTNHFKFGIGARHVWDIAGWKLSPSFGYEIFKHNLEMSNHMYPNPGIYLPLLTSLGGYVYGDEDGNYYTLPPDVAPQDNWYQVCMSPQDIRVIDASVITDGNKLPSLNLVNYDPTTMEGIWGVSTGDCVIIGGDGPITVSGTTHIYNTTWSGFYLGLEIEKQMTLSDKLRLYFQVGMPKYSSEGIWPNRDDWQQNPSFLDEGSNGAYSYAAELEYNFKLSDRLQLAFKVDTNYFHVGKIGGELYVAQYVDYIYDEYGYPVMDRVTDSVTGEVLLIPQLQEVPAHTEKIKDQLKYANWQSFGLHLGIKYSF